MSRYTLRLIRHGKTAFNIEGRYMGRTDVELSEEGARQIKEIFDNRAEGPGYELEKLRDRQPVLFSSPMKRCLATAGIIFPGVEPIVIKTLREMDFGIFEGMKYDQLKDMPQFRDFVDSSGEIPPPEGESRESFTKRVLEGINECCRNLKDMGRDCGAVVMHGGTIMALMSHLYGGKYYDYLPQNGGGYTLDLEYSDGSICL